MVIGIIEKIVGKCVCVCTYVTLFVCLHVTVSACLCVAVCLALASLVITHCRPHISDSGSADISATSSSIDVSVMLGRDSSHTMTLKATSCTDNIGHLSVDFHGGARCSCVNSTL